MKNLKNYLPPKNKENCTIRNKTLLFSFGCFGLFSIFSSDAMGKSALPQKIYPNRECITTKKCKEQINPLYISFYNSDYKNVCNAIGKFIGAKRVDSSELKVKFLPFNYDHIIADLLTDYSAINFRYLRALQSLGWYSAKIAYTYRPEVTIWAG